MDSPGTRPSVVAPCRHCDTDTVWLQTAYGGWHLFDAAMFPTEDSFAGNRFAIRRRSRQVIDLDDVHEAHWPAECLQLHRFRCPASLDESRHHRRRPRQADEIDLEDIWRRLAERRADQRRAG
jgi:hypothetical protein